jgi:hypothetical protein
MSVFSLQVSGIQIASFLHRIILSLACWALPYFPTYLTNGTMSGKKVLYLQRVLIFPTILSETFLILTGTETDIIINVHGSSVKCPLLLTDLKKNLDLSRQIFEKSSKIKFHENLSVGNRVVPCGETCR